MSTGRPMALALTEYLLLSKRTRQVFETDACTSWKPSKRPRYGTSFCRSSSKTSQIVLSAISGWQARREEALACQSDLVLDLPFFPASGRRASHRLDEIM